MKEEKPSNTYLKCISILEDKIEDLEKIISNQEELLEKSSQGFVYARVHQTRKGDVYEYIPIDEITEDLKNKDEKYKQLQWDLEKIEDKLREEKRKPKLYKIKIEDEVQKQTDELRSIFIEKLKSQKEDHERVTNALEIMYNKKSEEWSKKEKEYIKKIIEISEKNSSFNIDNFKKIFNTCLEKIKEFFS